MLFNSFEFLVFFIVVTGLYFTLNQPWRWLLLLTASCIFYMFFIPEYVLILLVTIVVDYLAGLWIESSTGSRRKYLLVLSILVNVSFLSIFKYYNFFTDNINTLLNYLGIERSISYWNIILPIGLSFHTFQAMSYTIEVYRGKQQAEKHFGIYALYVMFYPQLVAGPIERPQNMLHQFRERHVFKEENFVSGFRLILWGLLKKTVIADRLSPMVSDVYGNPNEYHGLAVIISTLFFAVQIYCDFSGYSDIALGSARVMGFRLMRNFNLPYFSKSVGEFWRRWHISLNTWFRDYLYIPLGGNRVSKVRWYFNILFVFLVSGLWHGANWTYIWWGGILGLFIALEVSTQNIREQLSKRMPTITFTLAARAITIGIICFSWIFFRADSLTTAFEFIHKTFYWSDDYFSLTRAHVGGITFLGLPLWNFTLSIFLVITLFCIEGLHIQLDLIGYWSSLSTMKRWSVYYFLILSILLLGNFGRNEFIYFQF